MNGLISLVLLALVAQVSVAQVPLLSKHFGAPRFRTAVTHLGTSTLMGMVTKSIPEETSSEPNLSILDRISQGVKHDDDPVEEKPLEMHRSVPSFLEMEFEADGKGSMNGFVPKGYYPTIFDRIAGTAEDKPQPAMMPDPLARGLVGSAGFLPLIAGGAAIAAIM